MVEYKNKNNLKPFLLEQAAEWFYAIFIQYKVILGVLLSDIVSAASSGPAIKKIDISTSSYYNFPPNKIIKNY
jgi:hypothetical protein